MLIKVDKKEMLEIGNRADYVDWYYAGDVSIEYIDEVYLRTYLLPPDSNADSLEIIGEEDFENSY